MKKLLLVMSLVVISSYCYSNAFAGTISISPFISGNDVTINHLESFRSTVQNWANGDVEGGGVNIKDGSINTQDLSAAISPVTRWNEAFNDFTYSGMLPATSASLTSNISAGVSYVDGRRIELGATAHTYTASKDTYVYIHSGGYYVYEEVANGASAPSTPLNSLLLAKVVTSGTAITSVSDLRTTSIQITVNNTTFPTDYRNNALGVRDSTTAVHLEPGQVAIGSSMYVNTSDTSSKSTATATNWIEGTVPTLANLDFFVYAYNSSGSAFDFKYASADPVYSDSSSNTNGTLRYYTTGGVTYRALAWISADSSGNIQTNAFSNFKDYGIVNQVVSQTGAVATGTGTVPNDDSIMLISEGDQYMSVTYRPTNANNTLVIRVVWNGSLSTNDVLTVGLFQNSTSNSLADASNTIGTAGYNRNISFTHTMNAGSISPMVFRIRAGSSTAGTTTFNGSAGGRLYGGVMASSITVTEYES